MQKHHFWFIGAAVVGTIMWSQFNNYPVFAQVSQFAFNQGGNFAGFNTPAG